MIRNSRKPWSRPIIVGLVASCGLAMGAAALAAGGASADAKVSTPAPVPVNPQVVTAEPVIVNTELRGNDAVDLSRLTGAPLSTVRTLDRPARAVVLVRTASFCEACGGKNFLAPIKKAAAANPDVDYIAILHWEPTTTVSAARSDVKELPNITVIEGDENTTAKGLPKEWERRAPAVIALNKDRMVRHLSIGPKSYEQALNSPVRN